MDKNILKNIVAGQLVKRPDVKVGDTVRLSLRIKEGNKERLQAFEGVVIALNGQELDKNITVRKISYGVGVEKIVPLYSPTLEKMTILKRGTVRRSKLYFLRGRVGRRALKISNIKDILLTDESTAPVVEEVKAEEVVEEEKKA
jgi:large subunit ribosomal protein L19